MEDLPKILIFQRQFFLQAYFLSLIYCISLLEEFSILCRCKVTECCLDIYNFMCLADSSEMQLQNLALTDSWEFVTVPEGLCIHKQMTGLH